MPVKKNKAKKHHRHEKNGGHSEQMNKDRDAIKKMVDDIPALIRKEGYFDKKTETQPSHNQQKEEINKKNVNPLVAESHFDNPETNEPKESTPIVLTHPKKILWLWTGVIIITMVIFGIWMLNLKNIFYDIRNSKGFEESIIGSSKQDFNDIWKAMKINDEKMEEQVKKNDAVTTTSSTNKKLDLILNEIITPLVNASTTVAE